MIFKNKTDLYRFLNTKILGLICDEDDWLANMANTAAKMWEYLEDINWCGFYLYKNEKLILGPFQGKSACTQIELGKGVCGTAAKEKMSIVVKNVHEFPGHIACDSLSKSEIVIPIYDKDRLIGVLDIDSPIYERFDDSDKIGLMKIVDTMIKHIKFPHKFI